MCHVMEAIAEPICQIIETAPDADFSTITISNQPRGNEVPLTSLKGRTLKGLGLKWVLYYDRNE
jgi:nuclear protein localization family protein 4